ncbi:MAG: glucosaminidase domain-containing protein [Selenomonas sp.]|uniref:glucosaminidase domain-containing protein n=1 Tax=Selenomonas sp. TaxID=2053611 RepID=UPI0025DFBFE0|nr:glucosaminidase domain-containing protein [Selenomonas sp.]MCI6233219.1 glucosaminidase domain-containing protein [Selenomonas sp.]
MSLFSDKLLEAGQQAQWNSPVYDTQGVAPHYDVEEDEDAGTISKLGHRLLGGLEGSGGNALKGIGTYLDYLDEKGRESSYIDSIRDSDGGYLKDAGDWFINNGQYLSNDATTMRQKYGSGDKYADKSLGELLTDPDYLFSSDGAIGDAMEGVGSTLPFIALNYLIPGSGLVSRGLKGASGLDSIIYGLAKTPEARKEAMKMLATGEGRETLAGLARQQGLNAGDNAARRAAMWALDKGAGTAGDNALKWAYSAGPMDALTNAAGMYDDLKEQGYSYEDMVKAMGESAKEELPLDMLNMALFGTVTKGTVGNLLKGTAKPKKIIGNLLGLPIEGLSEDYQEAMQQRLNNKYTGKEYGTWDNPTPDEAAAGAQGFIGSLLPGAFGTGMGIRHSFKGQDDRATRISTAWDNIRSLNGEPPMTNSAMDMIAEANASTNAKLAQDAQAQAAEQATAQPAFAVAEPPTGGDDGGAGAGGTDGLDVGFGKYDGQRMDNGANGCVEAVTKMGASYSPFLAQELSKGVVYVPTLVQDAGDAVIPFSPENVERGDIIVYGDDDHVVTADGNGGYYGNSTSQQKVLHGDDYTAMGGLQPTKIIKTGGGGLNAGVSMSGGSADVSSLPYGNIAMAISQRTGIPAQFVWAQMAWETGDFSSGLSVEDHNYGGIKRNDGSGEYRHFDSDEDYIDYASKNLNAYKENGIGNAKTIDEFAAALHDGGYFTDDLGHYTEGLKAKLAANGLPESGSGRASSSAPSGANFLNEKPSFDISREDEAGRKMVADFIDYWQNRAGVDDADTIQGMLDANGKFRNTQENRDSVREKWGDELQQYADEHMPDEQQQARQETQAQKQAQQQADAARRAAQGSKKATSASTKDAIDTSTPNLDAAKQQQVSTTPQATSIDTAGESEQTQAEPAQSLPNTAHLQPNTEHPASETAHPATAAQANAPAQAKAQQAQPTTQASQPTAQAAPIEQGKAPTVPKNETQNAEQSTPTPAQPQGPTLDAQQATKQQNALPQPAQTSQQATAQMSPAQQRARAAKEQRLQKELETNATLDQIERGQQLEAAAKQASVALPKGMAGALHRGQPQAIAQATSLLKGKGVALPTVEASGNTVYGAAETTGRGNSAQNATAPRKVEPAKNASGQQMEKPSSKKSTPSRKPVKGKAGKSVTVTTDSGKELHARYRIVPASSLTTSNVYDGDTIAKNDAYTQELQPRERSGRKEMQAQTDGMAADLHPADLEASRNLNQGAPLIRSDGVVLNGNGRTMAITRAYALRNKAGKRYTQYLIEHAEDFGFTKDQMRAAVKAKGTGKPVLVRELTDDADEATTQDIINSKTGGARMSATEQAETDAKSITSRDFDGYDAESDGDLTKAGNDGFVAKLLRKLVGKDEINAYTDANGSVNQDGYRRVKRAIFSRAYGDTDLIAKMAESMDDAIKNISNGLQSAAANVARLNLKMQEGNAYSYPLADTIARAVKKYNAIKEGKAEANAEAYASENETSLTGGDPEEVVKMVQALDDFHRSGKKVGTFLNHLADILDHQGSPKEDATALDFGESAKPLTLSEAIDQAREKTVTGGEQDLFGAPKYSIEEAKERHERTLADLKREIASAFPGAKNVREDSDHIAFTMPNGSHLEIWTTDNIELSSEEEAQAKRDHGVTGDMHIKVNGYEVTVGKDAIIALSKAGEKGTAYHEVLHIAMDILFSDREKAALAKKFGKGRGTVEEHIAEAFRRYKLAREHGAHVPFGKLFQRIQDFFANLADHYKELRGTMTDADVARRAFRELANGKAWERDAGEGRGARKFAGEANADENPVDNGNEQADNEGERKLRESLIEKVTDASFIRHISDRMTVEQIREQLLTQDLQHKDSLVRRFEDIERKAKIFHMTEEDAKKLTDSVRKVLKDALRIINAKRRLFNEPEVRGQLEQALRSADKIGSGSRLEKSLSDRRGGAPRLDAGRPDERLAAELVPGEHKRVSHPIEEEIQKELTEENHGQHYSISRSDSQDGFSRAKNPRKFAGEANADENPVDNRNGQNDNEGEERARFIDRLLNEKVPENGRTSIDSDVKDGIARFGKEITPENVEDVFDSLHCVRMLRATFNDNGRMQNYANGLDYAQKMAAYMYGYARRCFENDERIKRQLALRGTSVGRPAEVRDAHAESRPGRADEGAPRNGGQTLQGTSLAKHGNVKALQELYDKLVDEAYHGKQYSVSRSDHQDGFSRAQNPRKYSIAYHGTQHEFDKFDVGKIGRGEGTRVHGWGIYFAKNREVSQKYRDTLAGEPRGVTINGTTYHYEGGNLFTADGKRVDSVPIRLAVDTLVEEGSRKAALERAEGAAVGILDDEGKKNWAAVRDLLKGAKTQFEQDGMLAEANVPEDGVMLDEQKPFDQQPKNVQDAVNSMLKDLEVAYLKKGKEASSRAANGKEELLREGARNIDNNERANDAYENLYFFMDDNGGKTKGQEIYDGLCAIFGGDKNASIALNEYGVKGIKYNGHRDGDCYVVFDDKAVSIIRKLSASRAKEARARAMEDIKAEVLKAFPGAKDVRDTGDRITFTMPNGAKVAIRIHDNMTVTDEEAARARRAHGIADGVTITVNGSEYTIGRQAVIDLSQRGEVGTVYHEALHVAMDLLFDDKTKAALMKKYGSEEKIADAYRKFMLAEARGGHVPFGKPLRAIRDFFRALASHIAPIRKACGDAWTAQKAFEDLASGKAWQPAAPKKSHSFSIFSHAEAAERPIDNEAARGDNEGEKSEVRKLISDERLLNHVKDTQTVEQIREMCFARDKRDILRMTRKVERLIAAKDPRAPIFRKVLKRIVSIVNQHRRDFYDRDNIERLEEGLRRHNKGREGSRLAESLSEVRRHFDEGGLEGLDDWSQSAVIPGEARSKHPILQEIQQELSQEETNEHRNYSVSRSEDQDGSLSTQTEEETKKRAKGWLHSVGDKLAKGLHLKGEKIMLEEDAKDPSRDINLKQYIAASPSRVAEKVKTFRVLYVMADRAMNKVVSLRDGFERKLNKALALASSKDDRQDLFDLLLRGDAEGKEWTRQELIDDGVKENVADAYIQIRRQLSRAYHLVNDARRKPTPKSETVGKDRLAFLKANKFVTDLSVKDKGDGKYLVSYKEYKNYPKTYKEVGADMVERFQHDPGIQVVDVKEAKTESGHAITDADGKPLYNVTTTEGPAELHKLKGYIPHFFHEYFLRVVDKDGNSRTIGSARNQREAVMQAEAWMKDHKLADGETIHVQPKVFDINKALGVSDDDFAPVMGDKDFLRVQKNLAKQNDMTLAEAKDMLDGAVRLKGRHRFFGNALHRTGAAGFETDLDWALRHYFNSASRYVAMETEFKPKAISYFERVFGAFDKDYNNNLLAKYCKDYINDINGTPSSLEQAISKALNSTWLFKKVVIPTFGDRAALTLGNGIANKISYMTLGLNMSSALLNFSQLMNSAAYIGDVRSLGQMMRKGMHRGYSLHELRILKETGVLNDIGIDSGSGYDKLRGGGTPSLGTGKIARALTGVNRGVDFLGQKSMYFFQQADSICRRGTVLVAYEKARKEGKTHAEAIAYAKDVNNKANFQYGTQDAPNIFRRGSIVSQLALQFKKYGFKELEVMSDFSPWSKKTSRKQKLMFWGMYALLCGAMGVPALDWLDEIFGEKTGFYTKDELQKAIIHLCGGNKRLAVSLMYGIPAAFNINLSSRAGMSDVIPTSLGDFAGPTISKSVRLAQDLLGGDYANALRDVNPGLYNLYAAGTGESRGKRDRLNDRYVTAWDRILRAVGFRSVDETIPTDMQRIISRDKAAATKERQDAMDDYLKNPTSENKQRLKDFGIKEKDVQKEATKKNQTREERTQGTVPKKDKDKYKSLTDFMKE